jgi:hypothetical protein
MIDIVEYVGRGYVGTRHATDHLQQGLDESEKVRCGVRYVESARRDAMSSSIATLSLPSSSCEQVHDHRLISFTSVGIDPC